MYNKNMIKLTEIKSNTSKFRFKNYKRFNASLHSRVLKVAKPLKNKKIVHINATPEGGGVVELLNSQVALEKDLGIKSYRFYIEAPKHFFQITKKIHNLLQGMEKGLSRAEKSIYLKVNKRLGAQVKKLAEKLRPDLVVIHDPQPLPLVGYLPKDLPVILRFHGDISEPNEEALHFLKPYIEEYDAVIISSKNYIKPLSFVKDKLAVVLLAIDPLSEKNREMNSVFAQKILEKHGVNCLKPIVSQVSRFDPWKDPMGVVKAFYEAKEEIPDLQLVLSGIMQAQDDPQAIEIYQEIKKMVKGSEDVFLFANKRDLRGADIDGFVSALYTASTIVIQKSLKEGFGLTITEAMWKGKAVIAGDAQGPRLQIQSGKNGIIVNSPRQAATAIVRLINNQSLRKKLGQVAKQTVRKNFLFPRFVLDNLKVYRKLLD